MSLIEVCPVACVVAGLVSGASLGSQYSVAGASVGAIVGAGGGLLLYFVAAVSLAVVLWLISRAQGQDTSLFTPKPKPDRKP